MLTTLVKPSNLTDNFVKRGFYSPSFAYRNQSLLTIFLALFFAFSFSVEAKVSFNEAFLNKIESKYGDYAKKRLNAWQKIIDENQEKSDNEKLEVVNNFFNLLRFQSDMSHWGLVDYWASPLEFIVSGAGDCEDFSISKYFTLIELGVDDKKLLITYVKAIEINEAHMVLTYYETPSNTPVVLDNLIGAIKPANERKDLVPVYSFNGSGLWQAKQRGLGRKIGKPGDMNMWTAMEDRMKKGIINEFK